MKNTQVRRITAERLLQSKTTIPHYYLTIDLNADRLLELRSPAEREAGGLRRESCPSTTSSSKLRRWCGPFPCSYIRCQSDKMGP